MRVHPFDLLMELESAHIRIDCAALHLARDVYPDLAPARYLAQLDGLARDVAALRPGLSATLRYEAMRQVLVGDYRLRGNAEDYHDPDNSYLNRVLERRLGIPVSLSIVWLEVARRLKWPVSGLGLPGHFIIRFDDDERFVLVDPFREGRALSVDDCRQILDFYFDGRIAFVPEYLHPVSVRSILRRVLGNLRNIYVANRDWDRLANVLRRLAAVEPGNPSHLSELAGVLYSMGDVRAAYQRLARGVNQQEDGAESYRLAEKLAHLEAVIASLN